MSIQYAGGTNVDATYVSNGTQQSLINAIEDAMNTAGWTTLSGHHTGTIVLQSATTPNGNSICARLKTGNPCTVELLNAAASLISQTHFMYVTATPSTYRIVANQYQVFVYVENTVSVGYAVMWGVPYVLPNLAAAMTGELGWIMGDDTPGGRNAGSFRWTWGSGSGGSSNFNARSAIIAGGVLTNLNCDFGNSFNVRAVPSSPVIAGSQCSGYGSDAYTYGDNSAVALDAYLAFGVGGATDPAKIRGMLWDAVWLMIGPNADGTTITLDGKTFRIVTLGTGPVLAVRVPGA